MLQLIVSKQTKRALRDKNVTSGGFFLSLIVDVDVIVDVDRKCYRFIIKQKRMPLCFIEPCAKAALHNYR